MDPRPRLGSNQGEVSWRRSPRADPTNAGCRGKPSGNQIERGRAVRVDVHGLIEELAVDIADLDLGVRGRQLVDRELAGHARHRREAELFGFRVKVDEEVRKLTAAGRSGGRPVDRPGDLD